MGIALPIISLASSVIGTGISAMGALQSSSAQSAAANYQSQVAQNNAIISEQNAQLAAQSGGAKAEAAGLQSRAAMGRLKAAQAASGLDVNSGSAVDVQVSQRELGRLSQENIGYDAALQQYGYRTQATSEQAQAGLYGLQAKSAAAAGPLAAGGSLIGGAGTIANRFAWMQQNGLFGGDTTGAGTGGLY